MRNLKKPQSPLASLIAYYQKPNNRTNRKKALLTLPNPGIPIVDTFASKRRSHGAAFRLQSQAPIRSRGHAHSDHVTRAAAPDWPRGKGASRLMITPSLKLGLSRARNIALIWATGFPIDDNEKFAIRDRRRLGLVSEKGTRVFDETAHSVSRRSCNRHILPILPHGWDRINLSPRTLSCKTCDLDSAVTTYRGAGTSADVGRRYVRKDRD